ncbi:MAG: response regulator transcription factor [bacterium]
MDKKKILIIEDEQDVAKLLVARLKSADYESVVASDGYQGVEFAHKENPDLIILDLMLPAGDGLTVLKNIRLSGHTREIPIVVLTGIKDEKYKKKVIDKGVEAYLEKPYEPDTLITTIQNILKK